MAFYRKSYGRRRRRQMTNWKVRKIARSVIDHRMELKEKTHQINFSGMSIGQLHVNELTQILHGLQQNEREGERIRLKEIHIEGFAGIQDEPVWIRMALVWANYEVATGGLIPTPQPSWLWDVAALTNVVWTPRNLSQITNYCIIWEKRIYLHAGNSYMKSIFIYKKLDHIVKYHGGAVTAGSRGTMWFVATSDSAIGSHPLMDLICRIRWKDD